MASETPLPTTEYPDDFELETLYVNGEITSSDNFVVYVSDRETVIDSIAINCNVEDAACTAQISTHSTTPAGAGQVDVTAAVGFVARTWTNLPITGSNVVPANTFVNAEIAVTIGITDLVVRIRYRTRRK